MGKKDHFKQWLEQVDRELASRCGLVCETTFLGGYSSAENCFSGWCRGANVTKATNVDGEVVDVTGMDAKEVCRQLSEGELFISLGDFLYNSADADIEIFDFDASGRMFKNLERIFENLSDDT